MKENVRKKKKKPTNQWVWLMLQMELDYNADTKGLEAMDEEESQSRTLFKINKVFKKNYKKN